MLAIIGTLAIAVGTAILEIMKKQYRHKIIHLSTET